MLYEDYEEAAQQEILAGNGKTGGVHTPVSWQSWFHFIFQMPPAFNTGSAATSFVMELQPQVPTSFSCSKHNAAAKSLLI